MIVNGFYNASIPRKGWNTIAQVDKLSQYTPILPKLLSNQVARIFETPDHFSKTAGWIL